MRLKHFLSDLARNQDGATAIEYGLIAALIFLAIVVSINQFADSMSVLFNTVSNNVDGNL